MQPTQTFMHALRHTHALSCIHIGYSYDNVPTYLRMYSVDTVQAAIQLYTQAAATDEYVCLQHTYVPMYIHNTTYCTYVYTVILHS